MSDRPWCPHCKRHHRKIETHEIVFTWFCFVVIIVLTVAIVREIAMLIAAGT